MKQLYLSLVLGIFHLADIQASDPSLKERIEWQIQHCEFMQNRYCECDLYYQGRIDAYNDVLNMIEISR